MTQEIPPVTEPAIEESIEKVIDLEAIKGYSIISEDKMLAKKVIVEGEGPSPTTGSNVEVHYVGTIYPTGEKFDSSRDRNTLFSFKLGVSQVIKSWDVAVATMKMGEKCEIICHPEYGYGKSGSPPRIPPNSYLKFEIELFDFEEVYENASDKIAASIDRKSKGTEAFSQGNIPVALKYYKKALDFVASAWGVENEDEKEKIKELKLSCLLNCALCQLKLSMYPDCVKNCQEALEIDDKNVKALFRLGSAYSGLCEFENSYKYLQKAIELSPTDSAIKFELQKVKKNEIAFKEKERKLFKNMFA